MDMHSKLYSSTKVAEGAGINPTTLRGYYARNKFRAVGEDDPRQLADRGGQPHLYNLRAAMHVALAVELIRYGMDGEKAFTSAYIIHAGDIAKGYRRRPGGIYSPQVGDTMFVYAREGGLHKIVAEDEYDETIKPLLRNRVSFLTINLSVLENRMLTALGVDGHTWDGLEP